MAKVRPSIYKKGQSGNPKGGPRMVLGNRTVRNLNRVEFERICSEYLYLTKAQFTKKINDAEVPMIEHLVASLIYKSVYDADPGRINLLLDRLLGKVVDRHKVEVDATVKQLSLKEIRHIIQTDPFLKPKEIENGPEPTAKPMPELPDTEQTDSGNNVDSIQDRRGKGCDTPTIPGNDDPFGETP